MQRSWDDIEAVRTRGEVAREAAILVLDDIGLEADWGLLHEVIDYRADGKRLTIATTGLPADKLDARYPSGLVRRMLESGREPGELVEAPDDDWQPPWLALPSAKPKPGENERDDYDPARAAEVEKLVAGVVRAMPEVTCNRT